jgi:predicted Zn finger-like uncharacterized protein
MKIVCDACSAKYSIADEKVRGKVFKIRCKKCSNIIVVRGSVSEAAEASAPQYNQKETKVLGYGSGGGYDGQKPPEATDSAVWHLVIDQEQVGPMTVEEVRERFQRGEVDSEGYVWREGFGDWERLADVEQFASLAGGARADDGGLGALFSGADPAAHADHYDDGRAAQGDPGDLFAARGLGEESGAAADLFGGLAAGSSESAAIDSDGLFAGGAAFGGARIGADDGAAAAGDKPTVSSLTGQRNENSVLFSLNNLAALASDAPRSAPMASSLSSSASSSSSMAAVGSSAGSGGAPQSEGSGLIDIRSMAQVYLGESKGPTRSIGSGSADDLPVFSQSSFESASPVLLPSVQPSVNNRLLIALVGLIGVLVIAAGVLILVVLKGGSDDQPRVASIDTDVPAADPAAGVSPTATAGTPVATAGGAPAAGTAPAAGGTPAAGTTPASGSSGDSGDDGTAGTDEAAVAAKDEPTGDKDRDKDDDKDKDRDKARDRDRDRDRKDRDRDRDRKDRRSDSSRDKPSDRKPPPPPPPDPTASSGCDEVTCLVEPDKACCKKYGRRPGGSSRSDSGSADPSLPERPSRADVASGIGNVKGSVSACGSRAPGGGKVTVKIKIAPGGSVSSASATGGTSSLNGCVESAVKRARFPRSQLGASVNYPFIF